MAFLSIQPAFLNRATSLRLSGHVTPDSEPEFDEVSFHIVVPAYLTDMGGSQLPTTTMLGIGIGGTGFSATMSYKFIRGLTADEVGFDPSPSSLWHRAKMPLRITWDEHTFGPGSADSTAPKEATLASDEDETDSFEVSCINDDEHPENSTAVSIENIKIYCPVID